MRWSFPLGRVFGIPIRVHVTFFLLLFFIYFVYAQEGSSAKAGLFGVFLICVLFACVLAHELGHSVAALCFGTRTRGIVLLPIGGVALLEQIPREPIKEIVIALAGPFVSALIAAGFGLAAYLLGCPIRYDPTDISLCGLVATLFLINSVLILFNLIPAFPMDGGRVLRGLLSMTYGWERGTRWAARLGQILAVFFIMTSFVTGGSWTLLLIGFFVFFGAGEEERIARIRVSLEGATVGQAMLRSFAVLTPRETIREALVKTVAWNQEDFPVLEGGRLVGMTSYANLLEGARRFGLEAPVGLVTVEEFPYATPEADLETLGMELMKQGRNAVPVLEDDRLVGLISWEQVARFGRIRREVLSLARVPPPRPLRFREREDEEPGPGADGAEGTGTA